MTPDWGRQSGEKKAFAFLYLPTAYIVLGGFLCVCVCVFLDVFLRARKREGERSGMGRDKGRKGERQREKERILNRLHTYLDSLP